MQGTEGEEDMKVRCIIAEKCMFPDGCNHCDPHKMREDCAPQICSVMMCQVACVCVPVATRKRAKKEKKHGV